MRRPDPGLHKGRPQAAWRLEQHRAAPEGAAQLALAATSQDDRQVALWPMSKSFEVGLLDPHSPAVGTREAGAGSGHKADGKAQLVPVYGQSHENPAQRVDKSILMSKKKCLTK